MEFLPRNSPRKIVLISFCLLVLLLIIHQRNASKRFQISGQLSKSLVVIDRCIPNKPGGLDNSAEVADASVPNIIHQIWRTRDVRTYSGEFEASHESWKMMFEPLNYTVKLWTDDDVLELIKAKYAWLLSTYQGYHHNIQRADVARLAVVHAEGGIYADLDVYPYNVTHMQCLQHLGLQAIFAPTRMGGLGISNHFFMAERGSPFLQWALYEAKRRAVSASWRILLPYLNVLWTTGPLMVTSAFREYAWIYNVQPQNLGLLDEEKYRRAVFGHAAGRSWHGSDGMVLNYMADHVLKSVLMGVFSLFSIFGLVWLFKMRCWGLRGILPIR